MINQPQRELAYEEVIPVGENYILVREYDGRGKFLNERVEAPSYRSPYPRKNNG